MKTTQGDHAILTTTEQGARVLKIFLLFLFFTLAFYFLNFLNFFPKLEQIRRKTMGWIDEILSYGNKYNIS